jgi:hypothetical protein
VEKIGDVPSKRLVRFLRSYDIWKNDANVVELISEEVEKVSGGTAWSSSAPQIARGSGPPTKSTTWLPGLFRPAIVPINPIYHLDLPTMAC